MKHFSKTFWIVALLVIVGSISAYAAFSDNTNSSITPAIKLGAITTEEVPPAPKPVVTHIATPSSVKAVYVSAWVAGAPKYMDRIVGMLDDTELNAIVIDVKDSTGRISFTTNDPALTALGASERRIKDVSALIDSLHAKNVYVIGRISVFQDSFMTKKKPEWSIKKKSDKTVWKDRKGLSFMDPANENVWKYTVAIAKEAYAQGFDEINFDYIRYPSDGNIKDINYNLKEGVTRADHLKAFFAYLHTELKKDTPIPISADLFGLVTTEKNDMGIGQLLEDALPYFDFIAPMVYPSHFATGFNNFKIPAQKPYEVISVTMKSAVARSIAAGFTKDKIRPWLQDFSIKDNGHYVKYTPDMVRAQITATNDAGLSSWMLWDASNKYTKEALLPESKISETIKQ